MSIFCKGIFWFKHKWSDWTDKETIKLTNRLNNSLAGFVVVQERSCSRCKRKQLRSEKVNYV